MTGSLCPSESRGRSVAARAARELDRVRRRIAGSRQRRRMRREQRRQVARLPESSPAPGYETVCVVAVRGRLDMVARNVEILHAGRGAPSMACVLVVSNRRDHEFATSLKHKLPHTFVCVHPNNPLGAKWAAGVAYGRLFDPRGLMILGSTTSPRRPTAATATR